MAESEEELKNLLIKVKEESEKAQHSENYDHDIWSHHFTANRWETVETVTHLIFSGSKIPADGACSHEIRDTCSLEEKL